MGTTTPEAALDVTSANNGFIAPRIALTALNVSAPVVNPNGGGVPLAGTIVYNTATAGTSPNNVTPGYYYWNGTQWVRMEGGAATVPTNAWELAGNAGTNSAVNFVGTTDAVDLHFRTNGANKFRIPHDRNQIYGYGGTAASPTYSFQNSQGTGMWQQGTNNIRFSTNSTARFQISAADDGQVHAMQNGTEALPFYSWLSDTDIGMFRPGANQLGFSTAGTERLRITQTGNVGVATTTPRTTLEVSGGLSLNEGAALVLENGNNNNISLGTVPYSLYRVDGPTAAFNITGIVPVASSNGQIVTIENTTAYDMTIVHQATSTDANQILVPGAKNLVLKGQYATVTLQYNATQQRWIIKSYAGDVETAEKPLIHSVLGTTDTSASPATYPSPGSFSDMSQMTLTFTPESPVVYLNFSASGDLDTTGELPASNHVKFRIVNVTASNTTLGGAVSVSTDYDEDYWGYQMVASGWSVGFNMFPVTVTPGQSTTLKIQWSAVGIYAGTARNNAATAKDHSHRVLSVIDYRN